MTQIGILEEIKQLTTTERLSIIESTVHLISGDIQQWEQPFERIEKKRQLAVAANALLSDYAAGGELTVFTTLDSEGFYA